jgi:hypothetical protein
MRKSSLWRLLFNVSRATLLLIVCMVLSVARADTAACLRILTYSNNGTTTTRLAPDGILTLLADADHGRVVRETRFPARTEVGFSPVANRTIYVAADFANPLTASLIVQGKSGIFSEDALVQRGMMNDYFEYTSSTGTRRMIWSQDGTRLAYLWRGGGFDIDANGVISRPDAQSLSVLNIETGEQRTEPLDAANWCCLGTFSPDLKLLTLGSQFGQDVIEMQLWSAEFLTPVASPLRWRAGAWLPGGHEFVGIGYPTTPGTLHFMRWADGLKISKPIATTLPRRLVLAAYPSPDGKYIAFQSTPTLCIGSQPNCLQSYIFDVFTTEGELIGSDLPGLQLPANRGTVNLTPAMPNTLSWTPDSRQFYYLHEEFPQSAFYALHSFDVETREATEITSGLAANYMEDTFFPTHLERYYTASAVTNPPPFMIQTRRERSDFSVDYVALDGSKTVNLVEDVSLISELESPYTGYRRMFGWALDGQTVIIPWIRSGFNQPTRAGLVWVNADGTGKREINGLENVTDANVAVDMTTRLASRWLGFFGARDSRLYFNLASLDDERRWEIELPLVGGQSGWMTWFSRDGRYAAAYIGAAQGGARSANAVYLIDLTTGESRMYDNGTMAAWSRENDRLAVAIYDPVRAYYSIQIVEPEGARRGKIALASYDVTDIRAMSWNPCR